VPAPAPTPCSYAIAPIDVSLAAQGGPGTVAVSAGSGCAWTATSNVAWITLTSGASGTGNGSVGFNVAANAGGARSGTLTVAGRTFTVQQAAAPAPVPCTYSIAPSSAAIPVLGGTGTFAVTAGADCNWTANTTANWITLTSGATGTGNGAVGYSVAPNLGSARTGTITVAGQTFTVTQPALVCTFTINPTSLTLPAAGGSSTVAVTASNAACTWTARSNDGWINVTSGTPGTGDGTVAFTVDNFGGKNDRTGTMTIAGQRFTVTQQHPK
jgi:hypothetical protein